LKPQNEILTNVNLQDRCPTAEFTRAETAYTRRLGQKLYSIKVAVSASRAMTCWAADTTFCDKNKNKVWHWLCWM